jgi:tetratricopeptide (TPR) repeat protein
VATRLDRLAMLMYIEKRYAEAEPLYRRSLSIWEAGMGPDSAELATTLDNLAVVYASQEKFAAAEQLYRRSLAIRQRSTIASLNNLAMVLEGEGQDAAAERQYKQAVSLAEKLQDQLWLSKTLRNYAVLLRKLGRPAEAAKMETRSRALAASERATAPQ